MSVLFKESDHSYTSIGEEKIKWTSVTTFGGLFKSKFDEVEVSKRVSKKKTSIWYGIPHEKICTIWKKERDRSTDLGTWYHKKKEDWYHSQETVLVDGIHLKVFIHKSNPDGSKEAPNQKLVDGIYVEHFTYLKSVGICGQSDRVEVINNTVNIYDYKTNKEIKTQGYSDWQGTTSKMQPPINHLDDCNLIHYAIQLSLYMYMILKHNPLLKPGKMIIEHVVFKVCSVDEFGYPEICLDENNEPVIEKVVLYEVKYFKKEVLDLIKYKQEVLDKL